MTSNDVSTSTRERVELTFDEKSKRDRREAASEKNRTRYFHVQEDNDGAICP